METHVSVLFILVVSGSLVAAERGAVEDEEAEADRVRDLPGQPPVNFPHYSGYIKLDPLKGHKALFYWFFHAQQNSPHMPLVLWLNGACYIRLVALKMMIN